MIISDRFVYVHEPKTGGSFVTATLLQVHGIRWTRWTHLLTTLRSEVTWSGPLGTLVYHNNKHGTCNHVPAKFADRPFLATVRHPLDLYASEYEFGWWKRRDMVRYYRALVDFPKRFPTFPDLTFAEYVSLANLAFRSTVGRPLDAELPGLMTERFVRYYCRNPDMVLQRLRESPTDVEAVRRDLHPVTFLRTRGLNAQLHQYLLSVGYPESSVSFVPTRARVLPQGKGRAPDHAWERYYSTELRQLIRQREAILFELVPEFES